MTTYEFDQVSRFSANQIPILYFRALLNVEAPKIELMLASSQLRPWRILGYLHTRR